MNNDHPLVSVIIPLYNKRNQIAHTLDCVLKQSFRDWEAIIVDDGSTDGSADVVMRFDDPRIRMARQENAGVSAARNRGIEEARGEFVAFLDADDEWKPDYLSTQVAMTEKYPGCAVFATNYEFKSLNGTVKPTILNGVQLDHGDSSPRCSVPHSSPLINRPTLTGVLRNYFEVAAHSNPLLWTSAIVVDKNAIKSVGGFPVGVKSGEDLVTWAKLAAKYKIAYCKHALAVFIESPSNTNRPKSQERQGNEDYVLGELTKLYEDEPDAEKKQQIKEYLVFWHKVQSVLYIENLKSYKSIPLSLKAMKLGGSPIVFLQLICLGILPPKLARYVFLHFRR